MQSWHWCFHFLVVCCFFIWFFLSCPPLLVSCNVWDVTNGSREWAHSNPDEERQQDGAPCKCGVCKAGIHLGGCAASRPVSCSVCHPPRTVGGGSQTLGGSSGRDSHGVGELCLADVWDAGLASKELLIKDLKLGRDKSATVFNIPSVLRQHWVDTCVIAQVCAFFQ